MTSYFHIGFKYSSNLDNENKSMMGYNYEKKFFRNSIVKPCLSGKEFAVKGKWINPQRDLIREIQVFKTTEKISEAKIAILDYIVSGEGISSQTVMVANVEHELVTDLFITSKPPTPSTIERIEKHNRTEEQSISTTTYEQFDSNEKIALEIAIVFGHKPLSQVLPSF